MSKTRESVEEAEGRSESELRKNSLKEELIYSTQMISLCDCGSFSDPSSPPLSHTPPGDSFLLEIGFEKFFLLLPVLLQFLQC
jgi:hypothetical protein